jgi:hypothetical protein
MIRIVLDDEQSKLVAQSQDSVEVCDHRGKVLGIIGRRLPPEEEACAEEAKRALASDAPRYSSEQLFAHLNKLVGE